MQILLPFRLLKQWTFPCQLVIAVRYIDKAIMSKRDFLFSSSLSKVPRVLLETVPFHHASCGHSLQPATEADHRLGLCSGNYTAIQTIYKRSEISSLLSVENTVAVYLSRPRNVAHWAQVIYRGL